MYRITEDFGLRLDKTQFLWDLLDRIKSGKLNTEALIVLCLRYIILRKFNLDYKITVKTPL
jgi:hypothetical protein